MNTPLVEMKKVFKSYSYHKRNSRVIEDLSLKIFPGETLGLVGESGCGKSTVGRLLMNLELPTQGQILFEGKDVSFLKGNALKMFRKKAQIIFQDPYASLNPRMTIQDLVAEPLDIHTLLHKEEKRRQVEHLLHMVGLDSSFLQRFPHECSGGQKQRIGIARALALRPRFLVCDEPTSSLDVSIQAQIINLLRQLQKEHELTYLLIAHDLSIVKYLSDRIAVMYLGYLVELASSEKIHERPLHPYTQALLSAIPIPNPIEERQRSHILLQGEIPSPLNPPKGCPFSTRCPHVTNICHTIMPPLREVDDDHFVACHLYTNELKNRLSH